MKVSESLVEVGPLCLVHKKNHASLILRCAPPPPCINNPETGMSLKNQWYEKTLVYNLVSIILTFYSFSFLSDTRYKRKIIRFS